MSVSVLIPTFNERKNIEGCLQSVIWSDDVVVVDSGSTDGTQEISLAKGAQVVQFNWNGRFPKKKNWALENISWKNDWILIVDADERITSDLKEEILSVTKSSKMTGYFINRRFIFMGKWIRHCGYYPSYNMRLFRHINGRYEKLLDGETGSGDNEVHEHVILEGPAGYLSNDMLHFAYPDIGTFIEKHNRYSNWEALVETSGAEVPIANIGKRLSQRRKLRQFARKLPFRPTFRFLYSFILKLGILDGYEGYVFCRLLAMYELLSVLKTQEIRRQRKSLTV